ncbi:ABC transporter permease [Armatimonas sp.]|uniref:ABC transporter permease n=1 Tax=Armatimonas sp. TaxID=1872638 RepID=UPI00286B72ED|nr:ABC transporter permease [Armatimonas sp.]
MKLPLRSLLPLATLFVLLAAWFFAAARGWLVRPTGPSTQIGLFPSPTEALAGFSEASRDGRLLKDTLASLTRVLVAYVLSVGLGVPLGLWLGRIVAAREALLPVLNFLRALSPLAWIPFAVLWLGTGDTTVVFLILLAALPPVAVTTVAAVVAVPRVYFRVAEDYGLRGLRLFSQVLFPAIMPQLVTMLRVTMGLCWLVLVAAEMIAGDRGVGFLIQDANQALRPDLILVGMLVIGALGIAFDRLLMLLTRIPSLRWGWER